MPLLLALFSLFVPRAVIVVLWFFTSWFAGVFSSWLLPLIGFIILPYSLLWYSVVQNWYNGTWGAVQLGVLVIAVLLDLGAFAPRRKTVE